MRRPHPHQLSAKKADDAGRVTVSLVYPPAAPASRTLARGSALCTRPAQLPLQLRPGRHRQPTARVCVAQATRSKRKAGPLLLPPLRFAASAPPGPRGTPLFGLSDSLEFFVRNNNNTVFVFFFGTSGRSTSLTYAYQKLQSRGMLNLI